MKVAAKVFVWISMILFFYLIFPVVVGVIALKKLKRARSKEELKTIGILTLIFCSIIAGIFMISLEDKDLHKKAREKRQRIRTYTRYYWIFLLNSFFILSTLVASLVISFIEFEWLIMGQCLWVSQN